MENKESYRKEIAAKYIKKADTIKEELYDYIYNLTKALLRETGKEIDLSIVNMDNEVPSMQGFYVEGVGIDENIVTLKLVYLNMNGHEIYARYQLTNAYSVEDYIKIYRLLGDYAERLAEGDY